MDEQNKFSPDETPADGGQSELDAIENLGSSTLLRILEEKDKLIVSLKESSTRRDKLNEQQIRLLSHDNQSKTVAIKGVQQKIKDLEYEVLRRESEISIWKLTNDKIGEKLEGLKREVDSYRTTINDDLTHLNEVIRRELSQKEAYSRGIAVEFKETIQKLEAKILEVEDHYLNIINAIGDKQTNAKTLIREAMDRLQDALGMLDLGNVELMKPKTIEEEVHRMVDNSRQKINQTEEQIRQTHAGETVIKNIENVNIKLMNVPHIEHIFSEISSLADSAAQEAGNLRQLKEKDLADLARKAGFRVPGQAGQPAQAGQPGQPAQSGQHGQQGQAGQAAGQQAGAQASSGQPAGAGQRSGGAGAAPGTMEAYLKHDENEEKTRMVMDKENFAPFDWKRILNDLQLKKYSDLIRVCNQAIKNEDFVKAINLFKTIREQPGIEDRGVTTKMIDEEIEYLEKIVRDKYTRRPEPTQIPN